MGEVKHVETLWLDGQPRPSGHYKAGGTSKPHGHPADGMTVHVSMGDGAVVTMIDPKSFYNGGPEWVCRYGNIESIRYSVAGLLESYDYLLSSAITMAEATRRLRILRAVRKQRIEQEPRP